MLFVALISKECHFCDVLLKDWDSIINTLITSYPSLQFPKPTEETKMFNYPPIYIKNKTINNIYPNSLMRYLNKHVADFWYPMILIVPENEWINNNIKTVMIMNSIKMGEKIYFSLRYDTRDITQFKKWIEDTLNLTTQNVISNDKIVCKNVLNLISIY